jgi:hypothetical protein
MKTPRTVFIVRKRSLQNRATSIRLRFSILCCVLVAFACGASSAHATKWTGKVNNLWSEPKNWEGDQGPGNAAEIIDANVNLDVAVSIASVTLGGSNGGGVIQGGGGSLTVTNRLQIANGAFFGGSPTAVNITSTATLTWAGGFFASHFTSNFTLNNAGRFEWSNGPIFFDGTLNNAATGLFVIFGDHGFGSAARSGVINNAGRIVKETGTGVSQFSGFTAQTNQINTTLNNTGTVAVASGTLQIGSGTSTGNFEIGSGKTLLVGGNGSQTFDEATFTGGGKCSLASTATFLGENQFECRNGASRGDHRRQRTEAARISHRDGPADLEERRDRRNFDDRRQRSHRAHGAGGEELQRHSGKQGNDELGRARSSSDEQ